MAYINNGRLWVPDSVGPRPAPQVDCDKTLTGVYNEALEDLSKSLYGRTVGRRAAHVLLPWNSLSGLYDGIRDPDAATFKTCEFLRRMSGTSIVRFVIDSLVALVCTYSLPAQGPTDPGWRITTLDRDAKPSPEDRKNIARITEILQDGGVRSERKADGAVGVWDKDQKEEADRFPVLIQKLVRDSLTLDWAAARIETGGNLRKTPVAFIKSLDAARVRLVEQSPGRPVADATGEVKQTFYQPKFRAGVRIEGVELMDNNQVLNEYPWVELMTWVRNQRTDLCATGYGWPELASCVELVAGMTTAIDHNVKFFTHNRIPPSVVTATGAFDEGTLQDFLYTMVQPGVDGNHWYKLPFLFSPNADAKLTVTPFRQQEKMDMYWRNWLTFLIAALCAAYRVASEELNFQAFLTQGGQQSATGGAERVATMRSTGVRSLLTSLEHLINNRIVSRFFADKSGVGPYRFEFVNLVPKDEQVERQQQQADYQAGLVTLNEVRARRDERRMKDPKDRKKWLATQKSVRVVFPELERENEGMFLDLCEKLYEDDGGDWCMWPDAPGGGLIQGVWQQEHEQDLAPPQDEGQQWLDAQQGGPPQGFQQDMQREQFMAQQRQQGQEPGVPQADAEDPDQRPQRVDKSLWGKVRKALSEGWRWVTQGARVYEVRRRG